MTKLKSKISYKKKLQQNLKQLISGNNTKSSQNSHELLSFNLTKEFSNHSSNAFFSSTQFYESFLSDYDFDTEEEDDEDETISICDDVDTSIDSFCSINDNYYDDDIDDDDEDLIINSKSNLTTISENSLINKNPKFAPSKTSSRKSLLSPETKKKYYNQTLVIDYICNVCNLHLFKGQCIDCEYDVNRNKLILVQDSMFSSTMIANETIKNVKHHKHEIEISYLFLRRSIDDKNHSQSYSRVTHF